MLEDIECDFEMIYEGESLALSSFIDISKVDTTILWVKLTSEAVSVLDKFYRDLDGGSSTRTSPFYIYTKHRFFKGYFEFYKMEYYQIFEMYNFENEILYPSDMERKFNERELQEIKQLKYEL